MTTLGKLEKDFTKNIMGYSAMGIVLSTCLGSIAIMQILTFGYGFLQMALVMICLTICTLHNAAIISVQKPQLIFKLLVTSVIINTLVLFISLFL
ncbi:hypothetical protein [Sediminibacter sp. Hel_I_10]|uniref:hypothetical protein n=1 Tax=Sediminibacter sp. Hel_I_10 TaxID=1392490 RepID=UPI00047B9D7D|nr:hypothetical protein [Sediminibacter sp. Hel_I_10]